MKAHVQNPWTRSPSLMVNVSVEHAQQLAAALAYVLEEDGEPSALDGMTDNEADALRELHRTLRHALQTERPHGIKGVLP